MKKQMASPESLDLIIHFENWRREEREVRAALTEVVPHSPQTVNSTAEAKGENQTASCPLCGHGRPGHVSFLWAANEAWVMKEEPVWKSWS